MKQKPSKGRMHPFDVTRNRLAQHYEDYWPDLTGREKDIIVQCILLLEKLTEPESPDEK